VDPDLAALFAPVRTSRVQVRVVDHPQADVEFLGNLRRLVFHIQQPAEPDDLRTLEYRAICGITEFAQPVHEPFSPPPTTRIP